MIKKILLAGAFILGMLNINAQNPVNQNASPEAKALLKTIYDNQGKTTFSGQHCYPLYSDILIERVDNLTGSHPVVYGQDFGYSKMNSLDGINFRQRVVDNAIKWHEKGAIITLMWHAVPPTHDEFFTDWKGENCIQSKLTKQQWADLFKDGSEINSRWKTQVDVIAFFLKQLQYQNIPVIWRPYHEMNGDWFWWGYNEENYKKLYAMLYDRLVNYHKINNLLWVFNANELGSPNVKPYEGFYPEQYVDILATDFYSSKYKGNDYQLLLDLAKGKPIAIGECGLLPTEEILKKQPKWSWFMCWSEYLEVANTDWGARKALYDSEQVTTLEEFVKK